MVTWHEMGAWGKAGAPRPDAVPVVLLHGFPLDWRMYEPLGAQLADVPVLALNLPGAGADPVPQVTPDLAYSADQVAGALGELGVERCVLAGLSMGGYVAMRVLARHPQVIAGLALLDTKAGADSAQARQGRLDVAARVEREGTTQAVAPMASSLLGPTTRAQNPELAQTMGGWIAQAQPGYVAWSQRAMAARPDSWDVLGSYAGPAAVIVGDEDELAPVPEARRMAQALRGAPLSIIEQAGHMSALERPAQVAQAIRELLARVVR